MKFYGYKRPDGLVGLRNHVLILPTVGCATETCRIIAGLVNGAVSLINQNGCGEVEGNRKLTQTVLAGLAANPNVYGTILVGLGCEPNSVEVMAEIIGEITNKPLKTLVIQEEGGTVKTICKAVQLAQQMVTEASASRTVEVNISELMLGIECGGSDATSGLVANPVMGRVSDILVENGGTSMFSETPEIIGAEHILAKRCRTPQMGQKLLDICTDLENDLKKVNESLRSGQPSPGNKAGGITTLEEKSLGCIHKGGTKPIMEVIDCAQRPSQKGLIYMNTPGYDLLSVTAKVAAGCQLIVFTTGRGNPIGNPIAPVIKATANEDLFVRMNDNMDMDLSPVLQGKKSLEEMADSVLEEIIKVANGKKTKTEIYGFGFSETVIRRMCDYV
ncbi:MAG: UxaA family hydrolase [Negativicutes bacterium]